MDELSGALDRARATDNQDLPADLVRAELARILSSACFSHAPSLKRFLAHIVESTLEGRSEELKEYSLGVDVFGRGDAFDPKLDTIVRVQARRLRTKLQEYYASEGRDDEVVIALEKGGYVPEFSRPDRPTTSAIEKAPAEAPANREQLADRSRLPQLHGWRPFAAIVILGVSFGAMWILQRWPEGATSPQVRSLAVLPLIDLSADSGQDL